MNIDYYNKLIIQCDEKIETFNSIKGTIAGLSSNLDTCSSSASSFSKYLEYLIIDNKPIDCGLIAEINNAFKGVVSNLDTIISECDERILHYTSMKDSAIQAKNALLASAEILAFKENRLDEL